MDEEILQAVPGWGSYVAAARRAMDAEAPRHAHTPVETSDADGQPGRCGHHKSWQCTGENGCGYRHNSLASSLCGACKRAWWKVDADSDTQPTLDCAQGSSSQGSFIPSTPPRWIMDLHQTFHVPPACEPLATSQGSGLVREVCGRASSDANFNLQVDAAHLHESGTGTPAGIPMNYKVAINRHKDTMRDLGRKLDSVTGNITAIDELVRQLLATKRRFQVLEEDLKLQWALEGRQHAYLQQLVLEVSGHPMPLPSGSATGQPTSDHTHRELHVEEYGARCVGLEPAVAAKDRSRSPQSGTGTGNVCMMKCIRSGHRDGHAYGHGP